MREDFPVLVVIFGDLGLNIQDLVIPETKNTFLNNNLKYHTKVLYSALYHNLASTFLSRQDMHAHT